MKNFKFSKICTSQGWIYRMTLWHSARGSAPEAKSLKGVKHPAISGSLQLLKSKYNF